MASVKNEDQKMEFDEQGSIKEEHSIAPGQSEENEAVEGQAPTQLHDDVASQAAATAFEDSILPDAPLASFDKFNAAVLKALKSSMDRYGTVSNFLMQRYHNPKDRQDFANALFKINRHAQHDWAVDHERLRASPAEALNVEKQSLPLAAFSFAPVCSVRSAPDNLHVLELAENILLSGFLTTMDPIVGTQSAEVLQEAHGAGTKPPWQGDLKPFSVGFSKGRTRVHVLLAIATVVLDNSIDLTEVHPQLLASMATVNTQILTHSSKEQELIYNFKSSSRGSLRRAPSIMEWVQSVRLIRGRGSWVDLTSCMKKFNTGLSKNLQLTGAKAVAVRNLLDGIPTKALEIIENHVQLYGWSKSCFTDDCLSSKKLLPGYQFRHQAGQVWQRLGRMTEESCELLFKHVTKAYEESPEGARKSLTKLELEEKAEEAAFVLCAGGLAQSEVPFSDELLVEMWLEPYARNEPALVLEVQCAIGHKDPEFQVQSLTKLKAAIERHAMSRPIGDAAGQDVQIASLEAEAYQLLISRIEYDIKCLRAFRAKLESYETAKYHTELNHRKGAFDASVIAAKKLMASCVKVTAGLNLQQNWQDFNGFLDQFCKSFGLLKEAVVVVSLLNWSAICRINNDRQQMQARFVAMVLNHDNGTHRIGVCLLPQFVYQKNSLWIQEHHCLKQLNHSSLHVDRSVLLPFKERHGQRDARPLVYTGRILHSQSLVEKDWLFKASSLVRQQRTEAADQLAAPSMVMVEDLQADALPASTDLDGTVSGARKYEQLGSSAYLQILKAVMENVNVPARGGIIVVDASMSVGDSFDAWMECKGDFNVPSSFYGLAEDAVMAEWFQKTREQSIAKKHMSGEITVPGCPRVDPELPADHKGQPPAPPTLNVLQAAGTQKTYPLIPEKVMKEWSVHGTHGDDFRSYVDKLIEEFGPAPADPAPASAEAKETRKRKTPKDSAGAAGKRLKLPALEMKQVPLAAIGEQQILYQCTLSNVKSQGLKLMIKAGGEVWVVNSSQTSAPITLSGGYILCGYGKGSYKAKAADGNPEKEILYELKAESQVILQNSMLLQEVKNLVLQKRQEKPDISVAYHEMTLDGTDEDPTAFKLATAKEIVFVPQATTKAKVEVKEEEGDADVAFTGDQTSAARLLTTSQWSKCTLAGVTWCVKWTAKGLMPIRPVIALKCDVSVEPNHGVKI